MVLNLDDYTVSEDALRLRDTLSRTLDVVVSIFEANGVPLPARQYWTMGRPAQDCEQVVVSFIQAYLGAPGDQAANPQHCDVPRSAVLNIEIDRAINIGVNGNPPTAAKIQEGSVWAAIDSMVLMESLEQFDVGPMGLPGLGVIATVDVPEPEGGIQAVRMTLTTAIL